jgi:hypothetical protein
MNTATAVQHTDHEAATGPVRPGTTGADGTTGGGACRGHNLAEQGYVQARFGDVPVLIAPGFAAELRAMRQARS